MPNYNLDALGPLEFERMVQSLLKRVIGDGTITFGPGPDGGREAIFSGVGSYPSQAGPWSGAWIFQAKFHDNAMLQGEKARRKIVADLDAELFKITKKYQRQCDNYILATNVPLSAAPGTGTLDQIFDVVAKKYKNKIRNIHAWGKYEIDRFLESYTQIRTSYSHFITPGDVIAKLLRARDEELDEMATTLRAYVTAQYTRDQYAQLDQAGDVAEDPIRLQQVFFELNSRIDSRIPTIESSGRHRGHLKEYFSTVGMDSIPTAKLIISDVIDRIVLVAGPGEGKSTLGQYIAQLHRASILGRLPDVALDEQYTPAVTRVPLRIILRDFAQWIAEGRDLNTELARSRTLDRYICEQVRTATSRSFTPENLHRLAQTDPILVILDGLDEVSDQALQKDLLERTADFINRCIDVLKADIQVVATTRPTGYTDQFDPRRFLHLRLVKLTPAQVRNYVSRLSTARDLEPAKERRLREGINECLLDEQVKLLMNTPLQVTILVLIISNGGTPPRQREALFDEYLEVIYKRETAKGRNIIGSEKELLVGLHKYVGYLLHEKATDGVASGSYLNRSQYESSLRDFLRNQNPYESTVDREKQISVISRDAGERLVLIVEQRPNSFGFELRSIQEFFAASHLTDTAANTDQRYLRFARIAGLPHWRNVALFFAGRVGRNFSGEAANIVDVCREFDRRNPDIYIRRGAWLAFELAADRAFGPNRRHQRGLIDIGLTLFESRLSSRKLNYVIELIGRLPSEDIHQHLLPLLSERVALWMPENLADIFSMLCAVAPRADLLCVTIDKMMQLEAGRAQILSGLLGIDDDLPQSLVDKVALLVSEFSPEQISTAIGYFGRWPRIMRAFERVEAVLTDDNKLLSIAVAVIARGGPVSWTRAETDTRNFFEFVTGRWDSHPSWTALRIAYLASISGYEQHGSMGRSNIFADSRAQVPQMVIAGEVDVYARRYAELEQAEALWALFWIVHITLGDVNQATIRRFTDYVAQLGDSRIHNILRRTVQYSRRPLYWAIDQIVDGAEVEIAERILLVFGGAAGLGKWREYVGALRSIETPTPTDWFALDLSTSDDSHPQLIGSAQRVLADIALDEVGPPEFLDWSYIAPRLSASLDSIESSNGVITPDVRVMIRWLLRVRPKGSGADLLIQRLLIMLARRNHSSLFWELANTVLYSLQFNLGTDRARAAALAPLAAIPDEAVLALDLQGSQAGFERAIRYLASRAAGRGTGSEGAMRLLVDYSLRMERMQGRYRGPLAVRGISRFHRSLMNRKTKWARLSVAALFLVRSPVTREDWQAIADIMMIVEDFRDWRPLQLAVINSASSSRGEQRAKWWEFLEQMIPRVQSTSFRGLLVDRLADVVDGASQSLHELEPELGLPLQEAATEDNARLTSL